MKPAVRAPLSVDVRRLRVTVGERTLVDDVTVSVPAGTTTAVIGPNGSGKTTMLRALYRAAKPSGGAVLIGDHDIWSLSSARAARLRAVVTQHQGEGVGFTGREVTAMGRYPHRGRWERESPQDRAAVDAALDAVEARELEARVFAEMSGGERQRILVARALAQEAPVVLLDEPTNHLDVRAQLALLEVLRETPATTLIALHDVNHALAYADHVALLSHGHLVAHGTPADVITPGMLGEVFGVAAFMTTDPFTGAPHAILGRREAHPTATTSTSP